MNEKNWMSISDMMSGLMVIFLFISLAYINRVDGRQKRKEQQLDEALKEAFGERADQREVRFGEKPFLFGINESTLTQALKDELTVFFPDFLMLLKREEFYPYVEEISIEGFASTEWDWSSRVCRQYSNPLECSYMSNSSLSQRRARAVMRFCLQLDSPLVKESYNWLLSVIQVDGLSFSQVLPKEGAEVSYLELTELGMEENKEATRRVQFRITVDVDGGKVARLREAQKSAGGEGIKIH